jgi:uncharacterized repeat protein (TIGR03803 family)
VTHTFHCSSPIIAALRVRALFAALAVAASPGAGARDFKDLYNFTNTPDGYAPLGGLVADAAGDLYGTTLQGGAGGEGAVFRIDPSGSETIIYSFCAQGDCADGSLPTGKPIFDAAGNLYGTTSAGGACCGVVYELVAQGNGTWSEQVLHKFAGGSADGSAPESELIFDTHGNLYGTTREGGACCGVVFELSPGQGGTWTETVLHAFGGGKDGANPAGGLVMGAGGDLYGVTSEGGDPFDNGTLYRLTPALHGKWRNHVLHNFPVGPNDASFPVGTLVFDRQGNFVGCTSLGGTMGSGTVFRLSPGKNGRWHETFIYSFFGGGADGAFPAAGVTMDAKGNFYGTTEESGGGGGFGSGIVFRLDQHFKETVLLHFADTVLATPLAPVLLGAGGIIYGTTAYGGANGSPNCQANFEVGCGGVFRLSAGTPNHNRGR